MRINSSNIGMESDRTYWSKTTGKLSYSVEKGSTDGKAQVSTGLSSGEQAFEEEKNVEEKERTNVLSDRGSFGNHMFRHTESAQEEETVQNSSEELTQAQEQLNQKIYVNRIPRLNSMEKYNAMEDIHKQCILYLFKLFFGEGRADEMAERMGIRQRTGQVAGSSYFTQQTVNTVSKSANAWSSSASIQVLTPNTENTLTVRTERETMFAEKEAASFSTEGIVKTADGREISFKMDVAMSRSFQQYTKETAEDVTVFVDPLVINLNGNVAEVTDQKFFFDLDGDGQEEEISRLNKNSGYLALDLNEDGKINDGSELFGTKSGNGFADLAAYDDDGDGWIDEDDKIWDKLKIWVQDEKGNSSLYSLAEQGVGAICLQNVSTNFEQRGSDGEVNAAIRNTGIFLYENGAAGTVQHLDLAKRGTVQYA